ncbi:hypothetical protein CBM2634_B170354 [Cupriavidus taiwanensis]|uniref:Uncharacterized protein n=1 Tax=Cupriavidus taiwanensis TaxID=164546 RepID=A0A375J7E0_9BURK|nr:hypothetical protein CBM2634_B170354 [Cupriavidus taiwanensis]
MDRRLGPPADARHGVRVAGPAAGRCRHPVLAGAGNPGPGLTGSCYGCGATDPAAAARPLLHRRTRCLASDAARYHAG